MKQTRKVTKYGSTTIMVHETELFEQEAVIAGQMLERWGMVSAIEDGEDSAGRQKLRLATPDELVARAFACAKLFMQKARDGGLLHNAGEIPPEDE